MTKMLRAAFAALSVQIAHAAGGAAQSTSFGSGVAITGDEIIVSEPNPTFRPGGVYVYRKDGSGWSVAQVIRSPEPARADGFGTVLAYAEGRLFVGQKAGPIHVLRKTPGGDWAHSATIDHEAAIGFDAPCDSYGYCSTDFQLELAATPEGRLLIGRPGPASVGRDRRGTDVEEPVAGEVRVFAERAPGEWDAIQRIAIGEEGDGFGRAIQTTPGGILIGAPGGGLDGAGRVYHASATSSGYSAPTPLEADATAGSEFGASISLAEDGTLLIGAPGADDGRGAVYAFSREGNGWRQRAEPLAVADFPGDIDAAPGDRFGSGIAQVGSVWWIGAPRDREFEVGRVFLQEGGAQSAPEIIQLSPEETVERDAFGSALASKGNLVTVGAPGMHHGAGSVHVYERLPEGGWTEGTMLASPPDGLAEVSGEERPCDEGAIGLFDCDDVELLSFVPVSLLRGGVRARGVRTNDNWGWTDPETGSEYALIGRNDGTSFLDISDPTRPVLVADLPKPWGTPPTQLWRDIKTYRDHAYIVADGAGDHGMQVVDLARLRDIKPEEMPKLIEPDVRYRGVASSHNIVINEETGFAYAVGNRGGRESCGGGLHMIDIRDPKNPIFAGCFAEERGTHDSQCVIYRGPDDRYQGRELCLNSNGAFFSIVDVTDKSEPVAIARVASPNPAYIHQGWLTPDHRYFYQDDESDVIAGTVPTTRTLVWDLEDVEEPVLAKEFMGSMPASAHNLYIKDGYAFQANYRYGLHVLDITDPENPREAGYFDTSPYQEGPGFSGAWSTYPFFKSGTVIVTSLQEGFFLLKPRRRPVS